MRAQCSLFYRDCTWDLNPRPWVQSFCKLRSAQLVEWSLSKQEDSGLNSVISTFLEIGIKKKEGRRRLKKYH